MKRELILFLNDIVESIEKIESFSAGLTKEKFLKDLLRQSAVLRELQVIGEAAKNVPVDFREKHPQVAWKDIAGFRDVLSHAYFGIDLEIVWRAINEELAELKKKILNIKHTLETETNEKSKK